LRLEIETIKKEMILLKLALSLSLTVAFAETANVCDRARDMPHRGIAIAARISIDVTQRNGRDERQK